MQLTKDAILAAASASALPREQIDLPELGGFVFVRGMTGRERDDWERSLLFLNRRGKVEQRNENIRARLAVRCVVDAAGVRIFGDEDAAALGNLRADVLSRIFDAAQRLSNVTEEDLQELKKSSALAAGSDSPTS